MADVTLSEADLLTAPKVKRRANLVCVRCHQKKIKCNRSLITTGSTCSNCQASNSHCSIRASKRKGSNIRQHQYRENSWSNLQAGNFEGGELLSPSDPVYQSSRLSTSADRDDQILGPSVLPSLAGSRVSDGVQASTSTRRGASRTRRPQAQNEKAYLGDFGFMPIFAQASRDGDREPASLSASVDQSVPTLSPLLHQSFAETYMEYCFPWCPVLTRENLLDDEVFAQSLLLQQALALLGSIIHPPILRHSSSQTYYTQMKKLFYGNHEQNPLVKIISIIMIYWWSACPPNVVSMESSYFWTSIAIRLAQEIGLHREVSVSHTFKPGETRGLRRRIWWTLFARERLTSICSGRPCIIHPEDTNVQLPSVEDFPEKLRHQAPIFIHWVNLCDIVGKVSRHLSWRTEETLFPLHLVHSLIEWVNALPPQLRLPFSTNRTSNFDRHVHQLHLPYLTTLTLLYMSPSSQSLPRAYTTAILSASCVARIFEDYLARGSISYLPGMCGWYITIAILALLHARQVECLKESANAQIDVLFLALKEMAKLWHSSRMFVVGFDKLLSGERLRAGRASQATVTETTRSTLNELMTDDGVNYLDFFPGTTAETTKLFRILLTENPPAIFMEAEWTNDLSVQLQDLFDQPYDTVDLDALLL